MNRLMSYHPFRWYPFAHTIHDTYMAISIRVKCTAFVPSEAISRGMSYLGTEQGNDDTITLSSVGGVFADL